MVIVGAEFNINEHTADTLKQTGLNMVSVPMNVKNLDEYYETNKSIYQNIVSEGYFVTTEWPNHWQFHENGEFTDEGAEIFSKAIQAFSRLASSVHLIEVDYSEFDDDQFHFLNKAIRENAGDNAGVYWKVNDTLTDTRMDDMDTVNRVAYSVDADRIIENEIPVKRLDTHFKFVKHVSTSLSVFTKHYIQPDMRSEYPKDSLSLTYSNFLDRFVEKDTPHDFLKIDETTVDKVESFKSVATERGFVFDD